MRRKDLIQDVKIVEPPIIELNKGSSGLKKSCFFSCGFIFLILLGLLIGIKFYIGIGPKTVTVIPQNFPLDEIPLYHKEKIDKMTFISGKYKSRRVELAALLPKIVMIPFLSGNDETSVQTKEKVNFKTFFQTLITPITDKKDNFKIEWKDVDNGYNTFINYYRNELQRSGFIIDATGEGTNYRKIDFSRSDGYTGTIYTENTTDEKNKTSYAFLMLNMPSLEK